MSSKPSVACRLVACREQLEDGKDWSFYLINDSVAPFRDVFLERVSSEWGSMHAVEVANVSHGDIEVGGHGLLWRDDGSGAEFRMSAHVRLESAALTVVLSFDIPKLYRRRELPIVTGLGKTGLQVLPSDTVIGAVSR